jgi:hypothetical protein
MSFALMAAFLASPACGQTNAAKTAASSNRFLLIVDTSNAMARRTDATLKAVHGLLASGMNGQIHKGDSLGVWTFNADLHAGRFPLQQWSPEGQKAMTTRTLSFLMEQKYEGEANLQKAMTVLERVIKSSDSITVVLVTAGENKIAGTPFDARINESFKLWHDQQAKERMPIVTVLRANAGKIIDCSMTAAPWPVEIPAPKLENQVAESLPAAPQPQKAPTPVVTQAAPAPAVATPPTAIAPLIISGKKAEPVVTAKPEESPLPNSNRLAVAGIVESAAPTARVPKEQLVSTTNATPTNVEAQKPVTLSAASAPEKRVTEPAPSKSAGLIVRAREDSATLSEPKDAKTISAPKGDSAAAKPAATAAVPEPTIAKAPTAQRSLPAVQTALASPSQSLLRLKTLWVIAGILGAVLVTLVFLARSWGRARRSTSLITRSFDRK